MQTWINVGCGPYLAPPPWVNIDGNDSDYARNFADGSTDAMPRKPDVIAWSHALPYEDASVDLIYAGHLLEHLDLYAGEVDRTLIEFKRVLKPGGELLCVGPDLVKMAEQCFYRQLSWTVFWQGHGTAGRGNAGGPAYADPKPGDVHLWSSNNEAVYAILSKHFGTVAVETFENVEPHWPVTTRVEWQSVVRARR